MISRNASRILQPTARRGSRISILERADVTPAHRDQMFALLDGYYLHASREQFESDLAEKQWVLLGTDGAGDRVHGFTTLMQLGVDVGNVQVRAFFSGDTVFESTCWGRAETSRALGCLLDHMLRTAEREPESMWYWFMISSTYRSYRLLPLVFQEFHPSPGCPIPDATGLILEGLVRKKFGSAYDPRTSIIRYPNPTVFRSGARASVVDREDPWERFFLEANPGHATGDRMASLASLSPDNLTPLGRRLVGHVSASGVARRVPSTGLLVAG